MSWAKERVKSTFIKVENGISSRGRHLPGLVTGLVALVFYGLTLAPDLSGTHLAGDSGDLITAAVTMGVPHPPGYPTYVFVGKLTSWLPLGSIAYRFNLLSAISTAAAAAFLALTVQQSRLSGVASLSGRKRAGALAAGLGFAFAPLVWSQATIAEVYGLNLFFLSAFIWALFVGRSGWLGGVLLGLSITTHITSLLMLPMALLLTPAAKRLQLGLGLGVGLLPLAAIPFLARGGSPVIWGNPTNLGGWWWLVSGRLYHANFFALSPNGWKTRVSEWIPELLSQFTYAGSVMIVFTFWPKLSVERIAYAALLSTVASYVIFAVGYGSSDAIVLLLPALLLFALLIGPVLSRLGWAAFLLPLASLLLNFGQMNLSHDPGLRPAAEYLLKTAPQHAILMTPGDNTIFALWYFQHVERLRTDLVLVDANLLAFDWYRQHLRQSYPDLAGLENDDIPGFRQQNQGQRPFCFVRINTADPQASVTKRCPQSSP